MKLNYKNIRLHKKDFENYYGIVPHILHHFYNPKYHMNYLKSKNIRMYNKVSSYYVECKIKDINKTHNLKEDLNELKQWIDNNQLFEDIIED